MVGYDIKTIIIARLARKNENQPEPVPPTSPPSSSGRKMFPITFGDDFNCSIYYLDGGLFVNCIRRHPYPGSPIFGVGHGVVRQHLVIKVRKDRKINQAQRFIATSATTGGWGQARRPWCVPRPPSRLLHCRRQNGPVRRTSVRSRGSGKT